MDRWEASNRRVRAELNGVTIVDTLTPVLVWQRRYPTNYAVPLVDVPAGLLRDASPEGDRRWFDAEIAGQTIEHIGWTPLDAPELAEHIVLEWGVMDRWLEEDEEILGHPRDPYTRCDPIQSTRHVQVRVGGTLVADSTRPVLLFETGLPTRYYLPADDVRLDLLEPSAHTSFCPYKGWASYHSVRVDGNVHENIVWCYTDPFDEVSKIRDLLAFFDEKVEVIVDGVVQPTPVTAWS
jgi:uncharacterized protein (DUF427 family)